MSDTSTVDQPRLRGVAGTRARNRGLRRWLDVVGYGQGQGQEMGSRIKVKRLGSEVRAGKSGSESGWTETRTGRVRASMSRA